MRQHKAVVQLGAPVHQWLGVGSLPETRHERPQEQSLHQAHLGMWGHLKRTQFQQTQASGVAAGGVELVDAEFAAVRIAGHVDQQIAQQAVDQPRCWHFARGHLLEGDLQLVERVMPGLVDARRLAGWADERTGEEVGQRRVVLPVGDQTAQQVRPPQQRAVRRRDAAQGDVIAAASAGVATVNHKLLGAESA